MKWLLFWWVSIFSLFRLSISPHTPLNRALVEKILHEHNKYRKLHMVPQLDWSEDEESQAFNWLIEHDAAYQYPPIEEIENGINLWAREFFEINKLFTNEEYDPVYSWYSEKNFYPNESSTKWRQFTQLVWKGSKYLGCFCKYDIQERVVMVCFYDPPGNVESEYHKNIFTVDGEPWSNDYQESSKSYWIYGIIFLISLLAIFSAIFIYKRKFSNKRETGENKAAEQEFQSEEE